MINVSKYASKSWFILIRNDITTSRHPIHIASKMKAPKRRTKHNIEFEKKYSITKTERKFQKNRNRDIKTNKITENFRILRLNRNTKEQTENQNQAEKRTNHQGKSIAGDEGCITAITPPPSNKRRKLPPMSPRINTVFQNLTQTYRRRRRRRKFQNSSI